MKTNQNNSTRQAVKEYNSVILASLLHDIGKFLHRGDGEYVCSHEEASYRFVEKYNSSAGKLKNDDLYEIELIKVLVRYHHSKKDDVFSDSCFSDKSDNEKERVWKLLKVVKDADSYSCAERYTEELEEMSFGGKRAPLDSIFSILNLTGKDSGEKEHCKYHVESLNPMRSFPDSITKLPKNEIPLLIGDFEKNIPDFPALKSFDDVITVWLNLLEKYTWAIPSDTRYETSDVSLYDHLKSSAAIAACLYKRHKLSIEELKRMKRTDEFIFVGGDFSGIQNYIFDITNIGSGGASKRLRARSFFITLFSEVTIHKILHSIGLPLLCNLFSAGGKFLLLAPNLEEVEAALQEVKQEIEKEIHERFFSQFSFLMSWKTIRAFKEEFKIHNFFKVANEMFHQLETEKVSKVQTALLDENGRWNPDAFKATGLYESYQDTGDCKICSKGPAINKDPETGVVDSCDICRRDKFLIGQELPKSNYVALGKGYFEPTNSGEKIVVFKPTISSNGDKREGYYVELSKKFNKSKEHYLTYQIGEDEKETGIFLKKYFANHVPVDEAGSIKSFEDISALSRWRKDNGDDKEYGSDLLGVLKADIDNLGLLFNKGLQKPAKGESGLEDVHIKTVSRFLTMSRMLELFFSGWMKEAMSEDCKEEVKEEVIKEFSKIKDIEGKRVSKYLGREHINFNNIYTVYSGGDDLVLVGPWETMIIFSIFLNMQFRRYTCDNRDITLSAGLTFMKQKHPIASAIKEADTLLELSKKAGKDRITLFGTTVKWEQLPDLINFFLFLDEKINDDNSNIKTTFLYRLLEYHRMALRFLDNEEIEGLRYMSALSYDIGRNIVERDKKDRDKIIKGSEELEVFQDLMNKKPDKKLLIYNMKVPLFWALYKNRKIL